MKSNIDAEITKALWPIRKRLIIGQFIKSIIFAIMISSLVALGFMIVSFFVPLEHLWFYICISGSIILFICIMGSLFSMPSYMDAARAGDRLGLKERLVTALELGESSEVFAVLQRRDAIEHLKGIDFKKIPLSIPKKWWYVTLLCISILLLLTFIPNPQHQVIRQRQAVMQEAQRLVDYIEKDAEEKLKMDNRLTKEERQEILKELRRLSSRLEGTKDYTEGIKEISKAQDDIKKILDKQNMSRLNNVKNVLNAHSTTSELGKALEEKDYDKLGSESKKLMDKMAQGGLDGDTKLALKDALKQIPEGHNIDISVPSSIGDFEDALVKLMSNDIQNPGDIEYMLQTAKSSIAQAAGENIPNPMAENNKAMQKAGDEKKWSSKDQNAQDGQTGQGNQSVQGSQGSQCNQGNQGGQGTGMDGKGAGQGHTGYEKIYAPTRLGDGGEISNVKGQLTEGGPSEHFKAEAGGEAYGGFIPYNEVLGTYKNQAMKSLGRREIPSGMEEYIKKYFTSLED